MSFAHWQVLLLLFVPLGLLVWIWRGTTAPVVLPQDHGGQSRGRVWGFLLGCARSLAPLLAAVAIVLLAGPRRLDLPRDQRSLTNIEFCLDVSGSMGMPFGEATAYDAAVKAMHEFVDRRQGDAFGLTLASSIAVPWIPLTQDPSAFKCSAPFVRPENVAMSLGGGTMLGKGVLRCQAELLRQVEGDRMIILISDGMSFDLEGGQEEKIGRELRDNGIAVYYVHIGSGDPPPSTSALATITGGATFAAGNAAGLEAVFARIDAMRSARMERVYADRVDFHWPFCMIGFAGLAGHLLSAWGLRYTPW